jgi:hypothetical protein
MTGGHTLGKPRNIPILTLFAIAIPTFFLLMSLSAAPAADAQPGTTPTRTATAFPSNFTKITKSILGRTDRTPLVTGSTVTFQVTIQLGRDLANVVVEDIVAGLGNEPTTSYVPNSAQLSENGGPFTPVPATRTNNQLNRIIYDFALGDLEKGTHILQYAFKLGTHTELGCFRTGTNEAHLQIANRGGNLSTSTIGFGVRGPQEFCLTATPTPTEPVENIPTRTSTPTRRIRRRRQLR